MTLEEQKVRAENKDYLKDLCDMVGTSYSNPGLAEWSYEGWKRKYDGREFEKKGLSRRVHETKRHDGTKGSGQYEVSKKLKNV